MKLTGLGTLTLELHDAPDAVRRSRPRRWTLPASLACMGIAGDLAAQGGLAGGIGASWPVSVAVLAIAIALVSTIIAVRARRRLARHVEQEALFSKIAAYSRDLLTVFDNRGAIIYLSPSLQDILGIDPAQSVGRSYLDTSMTPASKDDALRIMQQVVSGNLDDVDFEVTHVRPDGAEVQLESRMHVARRRDGSIEAIYAISRDITEKRLTEAALRQSEARFRLISENLTDVIYVYNCDGVATYVSPSITRVLGYRPEERVGHRISESVVMSDADKARSTRILKDIVAGDIDELAFDLDQRRKDGSVFPAESKLRVRRDRDGKAEEIYVVTRDISERRAAEAALQASEQRYRQLAERSTDPIVSVDADGLMTYVRPASQRVWGRSSEQLVGRHFTDGIRRPGMPVVDAAVARLRDRESNSEQLEVEHLRPDGTPVWTELRAWPVFADDGTFGGFQFLAHDITEQKRNRDLLLAQQGKLEARTRLLLELNQQLDRFSATVSHDLRGPIRRVTQSLQALTNLPAASASEVNASIRELQDMDEMVEHLLNLSLDPDAALRRHPIDIGELAQRVAERIRLETGRAFTLDAPPAGEAIAYAAPALLQMVFANVLRNACRHVPGDVTLAVELVFDRSLSPPEIRITDNGSGFDVTDPAELFEYSVRGSDDADSYGIGLATVHEVVRRHGGELVADNAPSGGARIRFTLEPGKQT